MAMRLKVIAGAEADKGRTFDLPVQGSLHLGRGPDTDTRFSDVRVSVSHCRVYVQGDRLAVSDNGSTNGTFVNGRPLGADEMLDLGPGDVIRLGERTRLEVGGDEVDVMKTVAGNAALLARELAAAAAKFPPAPAPAPTPGDVPAAPPVPRPAGPVVEVTCACGQPLLAPEKYAGARVRCPVCNNILLLPDRPAPTGPAEGASAPRPFQLWAWVVTLAAGALMLVAAGAFVAALLGGGKASEAPRKASVAVQARQ